MEHLKSGKYIGSAEHKQNLLDGAKEIAEILKIAVRTIPENTKEIVELRQGLTQLIRKAHEIK